jgi:hypothetical protein|uniref:Uncharacterized protein n=1 Tax=Ackermannviridae sp. TaxID=2831612 RepID=A0A8S5VU70_9CAUD|nr:MAG TPA: hypothetical protein [Ackermannviridae sp.]
MFKEKIQKIFEHCRKENLPNVERELNEVVGDMLTGAVNESVIARRVQDILDKNGIMSNALQIINEKKYISKPEDIKTYLRRYRKISSKIYESFRQIVEDNTLVVGNTRLFDKTSMGKINQGIAFIEESYKAKINESLENSSVNIEEGTYVFSDYIDFEFYFTYEYVERNKSAFEPVVDFLSSGDNFITFVVSSGDTETGFEVHVDIHENESTLENKAEVEELIKTYHETFTDVLIMEEEGEDDELIGDVRLSDVKPGKFIVVDSDSKYLSEFDEIVVYEVTEDHVLCKLENQKSIKLHIDEARKVLVINDEDLEEVFECNDIVNCAKENDLVTDILSSEYDHEFIEAHIQDMIQLGKEYTLANGSILKWEDGKFILEYIDELGDTVKQEKDRDFVILITILYFRSLSTCASDDKNPYGISEIRDFKYNESIIIDSEEFRRLASEHLDPQLYTDFLADLDRIYREARIAPNSEVYLQENLIDLSFCYGINQLLVDSSISLDANKEEEGVDRNQLRTSVIYNICQIIPDVYDQLSVNLTDEDVDAFCSFTTSEWFIEQDVDNYINFVISFLEERGYDISMYR